jgi:hypothetical protein
MDTHNNYNRLRAQEAIEQFTLYNLLVKQTYGIIGENNISEKIKQLIKSQKYLNGYLKNPKNIHNSPDNCFGGYADNIAKSINSMSNNVKVVQLTRNERRKLEKEEFKKQEKEEKLKRRQEREKNDINVRLKQEEEKKKEQERLLEEKRLKEEEKNFLTPSN